MNENMRGKTGELLIRVQNEASIGQYDGPASVSMIDYIASLEADRERLEKMNNVLTEERDGAIRFIYSSEGTIKVEINGELYEGRDISSIMDCL